MAVKEISNEKLTSEEKDARGLIWMTDDNGVTYWFESIDDVLPWMEEHDPTNAAAIIWREANRRIRER